MNDRDLLHRLATHEAARDLVHAYATAVDDADPEAVADLFVDEGELVTPSGVHTGRAAIAEFYRLRLGAPKRHFVTNLSVLLRADGLVQARSYFLFTSREQAASGLGWGSYLDLITVVEADVPVRVRFLRKEIVPDVATDLRSGWEA